MGNVRVKQLVVLLGSAAVVAGSWLLAPQTAEAYSKTVAAKCKGDYKRLCPAYKVGTNDLEACMRSNHRAISNSCMNALVDVGEAPPSARRR